MVPKGCDEKERLISVYAKSSAELTHCIETLKSKEGTSTRQEYDALSRAVEDAHMANEQARLAFERHTQDHKC